MPSAANPTGFRHEVGVILIQALVRNAGTCRPDVKGEVQADIREARVPMRGTGAETFVVGPKVLQWNLTEGVVVRLHRAHNLQGDDARAEAKSFDIAKREVWEAYKHLKTNRGAAGVARNQCWRHDWLLDLDIKGFFDDIDHDLRMKAVRRHTDCRWAVLYIERWLKADVLMPDGMLMTRGKGTPQEGVIRPLLANLFLHCAFDHWMVRHHLSSSVCG